MSITCRRSGLSNNWSTIMSHCWASNAGTKPENGITRHCTCLSPRRLALSRPRSTVSPRGFWASSKDTRGGESIPEQYVSLSTFCRRSGTWGAAKAHWVQRPRETATSKARHLCMTRHSSSLNNGGRNQRQNTTAFLLFVLQELDQRRHRTLDVFTHHGFGARGITGTNGVEDHRVFLACAEGFFAVLQPQAHGRLDQRVQRRNLIHQARPAAEAAQVLMKRAVPADPRGALVAVVIHLIQQALQRRELALTDAADRHTHRQTFKGAAHLEHFMQLIDIQTTDDGPAIGAQGHQALGIQATKCLAHRHAAHADLAGDVFGD